MDYGSSSLKKTGQRSIEKKKKKKEIRPIPPLKGIEKKGAQIKRPKVF